MPRAPKLKPHSCPGVFSLFFFFFFWSSPLAACLYLGKLRLRVGQDLAGISAAWPPGSWDAGSLGDLPNIIHGVPGSWAEHYMGVDPERTAGKVQGKVAAERVSKSLQQAHESSGLHYQVQQGRGMNCRPRPSHEAGRLEGGWASIGPVRQKGSFPGPKEGL